MRKIIFLRRDRGASKLRSNFTKILPLLANSTNQITKYYNFMITEFSFQIVFEIPNAVEIFLLPHYTKVAYPKKEN